MADPMKEDFVDINVLFQVKAKKIIIEVTMKKMEP